MRYKKKQSVKPHSHLFLFPPFRSPALKERPDRFRWIWYSPRERVAAFGVRMGSSSIFLRPGFGIDQLNRRLIPNELPDHQFQMSRNELTTFLSVWPEFIELASFYRSITILKGKKSSTWLVLIRGVAQELRHIKLSSPWWRPDRQWHTFSHLDPFTIFSLFHTLKRM